MNESALVQEVLEAENRDLRILAANGMLPLVQEELISLQVRLAKDPDQEVAGFAVQALKETDPLLVGRFLEENAAAEELEYFARTSDHPVVLEAILRRRDVPRKLLEDMAAELPVDLQEVLVLRQDAIVEHPAILEALEGNPRLGSHVGRRLAEYRELMAHHERLEERAAAEEASLAAAPLEGEDHEPITAELVEEAGAGEAKGKGEEGWWEGLGEVPVTEGVSEEEARARAEEILSEREDEAVELQDRGLSEAQIRSLPIPDRLKLTRGASKGLRGILIKDANPMVAMSVLENNTLSDQEVESVARNRNVAEEVLRAIARNRQWMRKYAVVQALATNPKTPVHVSIKLITQLTPRDLKSLIKDRNLSEAVRSQARRLHQARTG